MSNTLWSYRDDLISGGADVVGYDVEALDGSIGKIDSSSTDVDNAHVVVDTGWWIFGKKRLIPAGALGAIDHGKRTVSVAMTKDQVKNAPDYGDATDHAIYADYYEPFADSDRHRII
jgi:hypothetical protein